MPLTLTVSDNQDDTGAVATVSGADAGTQVSVYALSVPRIQAVFWEGTITWDLIGSRTGSGTVNLPLSRAYYWAYAAGTSGGVSASSPPYYFACSPNLNALYEQIRQAVLARMQGLNLPSITPPLPSMTADRIQLLSMQTPYITTYPAIIIVPEDEQESLEPYSNWRDAIQYPLRFFILNRDSEIDTYMPSYLLWRERIMRAFREQRLPNVQEIATCKVQPLLVIDEQAQRQYQHIVSGGVLRFLAVEPRGI